MTAELNVAGIGSELILKVDQFRTNARDSAGDIRTLGALITGELAAATKSGEANFQRLGSVIASEMKEATASTTSEMKSLGTALGDVRMLMWGVEESTASTAAEFKVARQEAAQFAAGSLAAFGDLRILVNALDENIFRLTEHMLKVSTATQSIRRPAANPSAWLNEMTAAAATTSASVRECGQALIDSLAPDAAAAEREAERLAASLRQVATAGRSAAAATGVSGGGISAGLRALAGAAGMVNPQIGQMVSGFSAAEATAGGMGISLGAAIPIVAGLVAALALLKGAINFAEASVRAAADLESITIAFTTMLGSAEAATAKLSELQAFAASTPLTFVDSAQTARSLMNVGVAVDDVMRQLQMLGDIATGAQTDIGGLTMIYTQVINKGKADTMDLMQLANRGIPIWRALGESMNVTGEELRGLVESGKIGFPQIEAAFERMTAQGGQYHNAMANAAGSYNQLMSTLGDAFTQLEQKVGAVITKNLDLKGIIADLTHAIEVLTPAIVGGFDIATRMLAPFIDLARQLLNLAVEIIGPFTDLGESIDDSLGDDTSSMIKDITALMVPLVGAVQLLASAIGLVVDGLKWIKEEKQAIANALYAAFDSEVTADDLTTQQAQEAAGKVEKQREMQRQAKAEKARKSAAAADSSETGAEEKPSKGRASKTKSDEEREADRTAKEKADSLARAKDAALDAEVQALRNSDKAEQADQLQLRNQARKKFDKAPTNEEKNAINAQYFQDQQAIADRYSKKRDKDEDERMEREAKRATDLLQKGKKAQQESDQKVLENEAAARIAAAKAAGDVNGAEMSELDEKWRKKTVGMGLGAVRDSALKAYEAEKAELVAKQQERAAKLQERAADKLDRSADNLSKKTAEDLAAALRQTADAGGAMSWSNMMGIGNHSQAEGDRRHGAFQAMTRLHVPRGSWNLQMPNVRGPSADRVTRFNTASSPAAAANLGSGNTTVHAPVNVDTSKLENALVKKFGAIAQDKVDALVRELDARDHARKARGGI